MGLRIYRARTSQVEFEQTVHVPPGSTVSLSTPGHVNRGITHKLEVSLVAGVTPSGVDFSLFNDSTFSDNDLLYRAEAIDPASAYTDYLPFYVKDKGNSKQTHMQFVNLDPVNGATFNVTMFTEQFA